MWAKFYLLLISLLMLGILTAYCTIFASSLAAKVSLDGSGPCKLMGIVTCIIICIAAILLTLGITKTTTAL
jgi:hypothetical protein